MEAANKHISIIITAHDEGILIHKTLLSINSAVESLSSELEVERILHVDSPDKKTCTYLACNNSGILNTVRILRNSFSDVALSRNYSVGEARGECVVLVNAGDLLDKSFLKAAEVFLGSEENSQEEVLHPQYVVHFGSAEWIERQQNSDSIEQAKLVSVYSTYWNSTIIAKRSLLQAHPYPSLSEGYGHPDWWMNNTMLSFGIPHRIIENSVHYKRERSCYRTSGELENSSGVLPANPLLGVEKKDNSKGAVPIRDHWQQSDDRKGLVREIKDRANTAFPHLYKKLYTIRSASRITKEEELMRARPDWVVDHLENNLPFVEFDLKSAPAWLMEAWADMHDIDSAVISPEQMPRDYFVRDLKHEDGFRINAGQQYKTMLSCLRHQSYEYVLIIPWLIIGGADKYSLELINTIQACRPTSRIVVISTLAAENVYADSLLDTIDFVDLGNICKSSVPRVQLRFLEHLIENLDVSFVHVLNSELGYTYLERNSHYLEARDIKVIITSFNRQIDYGFFSGFTVTHAPKVLENAVLATSDNSETLRIWEKEYGLCKDKLILIRQAINLESKTYEGIRSSEDRLKVLWASRIDPQKIPEIVPSIARLVSDFADIDMYGYYSDDKYQALIKELPGNVQYKGMYSGGIASLPTDEYHVYLYTSSSDGTPNAILESFSRGLPVVAPAVGGIPDVVFTDETGILVRNHTDAAEYAEALRRMKDVSLREKVSSGAFSFLKSELSPKRYNETVEAFVSALGM